MTHDELVNRINEDERLSHLYGHSCHQRLLKYFNSLRAVVELHKPIEEDGKLWCEQEVCYNHIEFLERDDCDCFYPCPTIQEIMDELK